MPYTVTPRERGSLWRRDGLLYLGQEDDTGDPIGLTKETFSLSHVHMIGPTGSGKTKGLYQINQPLLLDPYGSFVLIDGKPGGELYYETRDFCFAYGLQDRLELLDFSDQTRVTGYSPMQPNGLLPSAQAKKVQQGLRASTGASSFDETRQLQRFTFIAVYTARLFNMDLEEAWKILLPESELRAKLLPKVTDRYLKYELEYLSSLQKNRQDQLVSSSLALIEQLIANPYTRRYLSHRPSINIKEIMQQKRILLINMGHEDPLGIDDVRVLGRMIVNDVITSCFSNQGKYGNCYLVLDEAHLLLSRDICSALDMGRGLKLRGIFAHQYLDQLGEEDVSGYLASSMMSSARTKIIFGGLSTADLEILEKETRIGEIDIYKRKHTLYNLENVVTEETREIVTEGESQQFTKGMSRPHTVTETDGWTESDTETESTGLSASHATSQSHTNTLSNTRTRSNSQAHITSEGENKGEGQGQSLSLMDGSGSLQPPTGDPTSTISLASATGLVDSRFQGKSKSTARALAFGTADSVGTARSDTHGRTDTFGLTNTTGTAHTVGRSGSRAVSDGETPSESESRGKNRSVATHPFQAIVQRERESSIEYVPPADQSLVHIQQMKFRPTTHAMLSVPMMVKAVFLHFDWLEKPLRLLAGKRERSHESATNREHTKLENNPEATIDMHETAEDHYEPGNARRRVR